MIAKKAVTLEFPQAVLSRYEWWKRRSERPARRSGGTTVVTVKDASSERDFTVKYTKAAAVVAGTMLAVGAGAPAFADDVDNAPTVSSSDELANSSTVTKTTAKNPLKDVNADVIIGGISKVADKLNTKNDLASKTAALQGATARAAEGTPLMGGLPMGG